MFSFSEVLIKKGLIFIVLLGSILSSHSQTYVKIFRPKGSHAPGSVFDVKFNGQKITELKNGYKLEYEFFGSGNLMIDISASNISRERQNAIEVEVYPNETVYIEAGINEYLESYFRKVNVYQGKAKFNDPKAFKKDGLISLKDNQSNPILKPKIAYRETVEKKPVPVYSNDDFKIEITSPEISEGKVHEFLGETLIVKGKVSDAEVVDEISVNGNKAQILSEGKFEVSVSFDQFLENDVYVKVFTKGGKFYKKDFVVKRMLSEYDMAKRERQGKDYALIFATNEFDEFNDLTNPIFDADRVTKELTDLYGFEVEKKYNNTQKDIYLTLKEYSKRAFHPNDQLFIFFAGHGDFDYLFSEGYVVCKDSKKDDEARSSYISHSNLRTIIDHIPCEHIFLVMDVCFGGTFDPVIAARGSDEYSDMDKEKFIKRKMQYKTRLYLTSGGKEYVPDGRPGMHSPFAKNLISAFLTNGGADGILTYGEILHQIEKTSPQPQTGEFGSNALGSDFLFIVK
jgi:hypothetical protein